ncbi:phage portal protein [Pararhodobacter sp.]|uniref:phage portal protein n=1 Tax=Pararhodobacter sp. TaxID=2127056 RepID=UPI002FDEBB32
MNWRQRLGAFIGGFDAGQHHRRLRGFRATRAHVNALIAAAGPDITARARWLVRNNGYAVNAVESWAANTVGDGIKPISKIADPARKEELQRLWLAWTDEADAEGLTDFYGLQRRAAREVFMAGGGPANLLETANTIGLPLYARQMMDAKGRWIDLMTEASILPVNKRPRLAIRLHSSN